MRITFSKIKQKAFEWCKLHYRFSAVETCEDYAAKRNEKCIVIKPREEVFVTPVRYIGEPQRDDVIGHLPTRYLAILPDVEIIGSSNVIVGDNSIVYDLLARNNDNYNITDRGLFRFLNSPVCIFNKYVICYNRKGEKIDEGINLVGNFSGNYYHYIYEIIIKWYLIDKIEIPEYVPILVDAVARDIPQFGELLKLFLRGREVIYVEKGEIRSVSKLYNPSMVNFMPPNPKKMEYLVSEDYVFDKEAILFLRESFLSYMEGANIKTPKKFFISRKSTKWRKYNEDEVIKEVISKGYEVVYPETMTVREQFWLFNQADEIIAASGAALSNIVCCHPGARVLVLISVRLEATIFSTIAKILNVNLEYFVGSVTTNNSVQSDFAIDCQKLKEVLSQ